MKGSPMRIAFLVRSLETGGSQRQLVLLARGLAERGHRIAVVTLYEGGALESDLAGSGVRRVALGKRGRWDPGPWLVRLVAFLRRERPEIVHGYLDAGNLLAAFLGPLVRARVVWGLRAGNMDMRRYGRFQAATHRFERALSRIPDLCIANSAAGRAHAIARGFPPGKIVVVPNGIDTNRFRPDRKAGEPLRAAWGVREDEALVGVVARLDPMKDHGTFLHAAERLLARRRSVRFVCVGSGPRERELRDLADTLDVGERVVWAGERSDVPAVYNACDVACLPSAFGEGFPNVVAEAMACGIPCVVTDVGDAASIVDDPALVVPPGDAERLATALDAALARPQGHEARATRHDRIETRFGVQQLLASAEASLGGLR